MSLPKDIIVVRHGQTAFNKEGVVQGKGVDSVLNEKGLAQAMAFYEAYKDFGFEKVYCSTLTRTHQTAKPFLDDGIPFENRQELDEIDWGNHEGKASDHDDKSAYFDMVRAWKAGELDRKVEGGESPLDVKNRQMPFLKELKEIPETKVLLVIHGRAIRILMCNLMGEDLSNMDKYPHQNLGLYHLRLTEMGYEMLKHNDSEHLKEVNERFKD